MLRAGVMTLQRVCEGCGDVFDTVRANARSCSDACRQRLRHRAKREPVAVLPTVVVDLPVLSERVLGELEARTLVELEAVGRAESALGVAALLTARRLDAGGRETAGGVASLLAAYRSTFAEATADAERAGDVLDELRSFAALKVVNGG